MTTSLFAAAGLQDCADAGMDCMPGFGLFLSATFGGLLFLLVWVSVCMAASVSVVTAFSRLGLPRTLAFLLGIWLVPIAGLGLWLYYGRSPQRGSNREPAATR
ncbi:hypothetical protein [Rhodococcus sovatensis]|uniref:Phospholipase_D-nuclease N-terminal n=1 Tax=Rhodococcus sovatensis TaxID=1805840 RepID=A0ABZ2PWP3_9NOCA